MAGEIVTLLFTDIVDSTGLLARVGDDAFDDVRRTHFRLLRDAVAAGGGTEVKNLGDGLMAAFALPSDALGTAVAMREAVELHNRKANDPLQMRIGLHVGESIRDKADYHGTTVVVAKRLCDEAAAGQILVSSILRNVVGGRGGFSFGEPRSVVVEGIAEPLLVCAVARPTAASPSLPRALASPAESFFVGRADEFALLERLWHAAEGGDHRAVFVAGEPGIGKTRLAAELAKRVHEQGAVVLYGRCDEYLSVPYQPFAEALAGYADAVPPETLRAVAGLNAAELAGLLPSLAGRAGAQRPSTEGDPGIERHQLFEAVANLVGGMSIGAPLLLVLDDLHWATKPTLLLLRHLCAAPGSVLLVATYRESEVDLASPLGAVLAELARQEHVERLTLTGLSPREVDDYLRAATDRIAGAARSPELARALWQATEGNPFFVGEIVAGLDDTAGLGPGLARPAPPEASREATARHLVDRLLGRTEEEDPTRTGDQTDPGAVEAPPRGALSGAERFPLPIAVREVLGRRVARLAPPTTRIVTVAAVIGPEFAVDVLRRVTDVGEDDLLDALDEARRNHVVVEASDPDRYRFSHVLIRQALYEEVSASRKLRLHARIAEAVEDLYSETIGEHLTELAYHVGQFPRAAGAERAIEYARRAAGRALELLAYEDAAAQYQHALVLLDELDPSPDDVRCELLLDLAEAQVKAGEVELATDSVRRAADLARSVGSAESLARAAVAWPVRLLAAGVVPSEPDMELIDLLEEALVALPPTSLTLRARALSRLAVECYASSPPERVTALSDEALSIARRTGDDGVLAAVLSDRAVAIWRPDRLEERIAVATELVELAERRGDRDRAVWAHVWRSVAVQEKGDVVGADTESAAVLSLVEELRQSRHVWLATYRRGGQAITEGRFDEAEELIDAALAIGEGEQPVEALLGYGAQLAALRYLQGRVGEIEESIAAFIDQYPAIPAWRAALAVVYAELDRENEARREFDALTQNNFADIPWDIGWLLVLALLTDACSFLDDSARAEQLYALLLPYGDRCLVMGGGLLAWGSAARHVALAAATARRWDEAEAWFEAGIDQNARMRMAPWQALTEHDYARMRVARGGPGDETAARRLGTRALATAERLGMAGLATKARRLLAQVGG